MENNYSNKEPLIKIAKERAAEPIIANKELLYQK
jgi:hypothetical protein